MNKDFSISLEGLATEMPDNIIDNHYFESALKDVKSKMFTGTKFRRHALPGQTATDLISRASVKLINRLNLSPEKDIDIIITNVNLPDECFTGCGAAVAHRIKAKTKWIVDLHNTGCIAFIYMAEMARSLMYSHGYKKALICTAQTAAAKVFTQPENRELPQASIPGDGCAVAYIVAGDSHELLPSVSNIYPEFSEDMVGLSNTGRKYWEPGESNISLSFNEAKIAKITVRSNRIVPKAIKEACEKHRILTSDINFLITNQPNPFFMRNWREAVGISEDKHLNTFEKYANIFGSGIPVTLCEAIDEGKIRSGNLISLAGFSHAGDYASATILKW